MNQNNREPTDPLYVFSKSVINGGPNDITFYEVSHDSPLDHFYSKEKQKAKNELHLLTTGSGQIHRDSPILKRKKELYFPDPLFMKEDLNELGLTKQSRRFEQEILNSLDFQNELSAFVQSKQIGQMKQEKPQNKARKKNPNLDIAQIPSDLYPSYYHYLPQEYQSPLFMSSPKYSFKAVLKGDKNFVSQLTELIAKEKRPKLLSRYLSNRAFGFMSNCLYQMAKNDCNTSIASDKYNTFAYYLKGAILLFELKELNAINVWRSSLHLDYYDRYSLLMKHLIQDHNIRHTLFRLQNNIRDFISFTEKYNASIIYYSDDIQIGYSKLSKGFVKEAIEQFENILRVKPFDEKANIGHSIALYQKGEYILASKGFSDLSSIKSLPPEYSKFYGIVNASLHYDKNAVDNLSNSIQNNPTDYQSLLLRAETQIERGHYKMAIHDLLNLPDNLRTDKVFVLMAECYSWMGKLQKTLDALRFVSPSYEDSSLYLCHFIVARDHCDYEEAMSCIKKAVCLNPSFNLLKIAGDYFYSNAYFDDAVSFYQMALQARQNSPMVLRNLAFALIHSGNEMEGAKILKNIGKNTSGGDLNFANNLCPSPTSTLNAAGGGWATDMNVKYLDQWIYDFGNIEVTRHDIIESRMNPFSPLLKSDSTDYRFILHLMNIIDMPFELALRDKIVDCGKGRMPFNRNKITIPNANSGSKTEEGKTSKDSSTSNEKDDVILIPKKKKEPIVEDAEKLGMKCNPNTYEVTQNIRVIRALGLSVLYLAHFMRNEMEKMIDVEKAETAEDAPPPRFVISHWTKPFDIIRSILQIADFKLDVKWISTLSSSMVGPTSVVSSPPPNECFGFRSRESENAKDEVKNETKEEKKKTDEKDNHHSHKRKIKRKVATTPAPFKRPIRPYTGNPFEEQIVDSQCAPMYFIQSGIRLPPRFQHISNTVFVKLAIAATTMVSDQHRNFSNSELSEISKSAKRLYRIVQKDISSVRKYDNGRTRLQAPTITLRYLGALGYEVYVSPPLTPKHRMRYYICIEDCWTELIKGGAQAILFNSTVNEIQATKTNENVESNKSGENKNAKKNKKENQNKKDSSAKSDQQTNGNENENTSDDKKSTTSNEKSTNENEKNKPENSKKKEKPTASTKSSNGDESANSKRRSHYRNQGQLAMIVMLIWMLHPFSCYSPEIGHIILHAHLLASSNEEIDKIDSVNEMFIEQMVDPDIQKMRNVLNQILMKRTKSTVRPESLSFWDSQRSLRDIMNLIGS